ncbi:hypothetical protein N0V83_000879 [Neocucurbitaria cava]|uniref:Uncharacterized protein n=1 Tax=Neocucurbitaria cava TaxID=798079 RepID=A0A9W8YI48_9PLEO|nr:hypothetical protein N0V83_000879 [Neocucurbitaria cava]
MKIEVKDILSKERGTAFTCSNVRDLSARTLSSPYNDAKFEDVYLRCYEETSSNNEEDNLEDAEGLRSKSLDFLQFKTRMSLIETRNQELKKAMNYQVAVENKVTYHLGELGRMQCVTLCERILEKLPLELRYEIYEHIFKYPVVHVDKIEESPRALLETLAIPMQQYVYSREDISAFEKVAQYTGTVFASELIKHWYRSRIIRISDPFLQSLEYLNTKDIWGSGVVPRDYICHASIVLYFPGKPDRVDIITLPELLAGCLDGFKDGTRVTISMNMNFFRLCWPEDDFEGAKSLMGQLLHTILVYCQDLQVTLNLGDRTLELKLHDCIAQNLLGLYFEVNWKSKYLPFLKLSISKLCR